MISITLDVGNVSSVLAAFSHPQLAQRIVNAVAESYTGDTLDWIQAGHAFTTRTGQLEQSIDWHPNGNGSSTVFANAEYALPVEFGSKPHVIRPKNGKALRFSVGGGAGFGFARVINHPGSKAHPFFFADRDKRVDNMQAAAMSVLARVMGGQYG